MHRDWFRFYYTQNSKNIRISVTKTQKLLALRQIQWPLVLHLTVMNESCHTPDKDIPQATTTAVMKHFGVMRATPVEVVLNFISLNFIKVYASRGKDSGCFFFCFSFNVYKS